MDGPWLNKINRERRIDPREALKRLRTMVELNVALSDLPADVKSLRTHGLKRDREIREACLFCHGMAQRIGQPVWVYPVEDADYDFVAAWEVDDTRHFAPVQLKEVVPKHRNPSASLQAIVDRLTRYQASDQLTVAIHFNRAEQIDLRRVSVPPLALAGLWVFGAISEDQSQWALWGNMLEVPAWSAFEHPT